MRNALSDVWCVIFLVVSVKEVLFCVRLDVVFGFRFSKRFLVRFFSPIHHLCAVQKFHICPYHCTMRCHCREDEFLREMRALVK